MTGRDEPVVRCTHIIHQFPNFHHSHEFFDRVITIYPALAEPQARYEKPSGEGQKYNECLQANYVRLLMGNDISGGVVYGCQLA